MDRVPRHPTVGGGERRGEKRRKSHPLARAFFYICHPLPLSPSEGEWGGEKKINLNRGPSFVYFTAFADVGGKKEEERKDFSLTGNPFPYNLSLRAERKRKGIICYPQEFSLPSPQNTPTTSTLRKKGERGEKKEKGGEKSEEEKRPTSSWRHSIFQLFIA